MKKVGGLKHNPLDAVLTLRALIIATAMVAVVLPSISTAAPLSPPTIPPIGAYVGAWVNPKGLNEAPGTEAGTVEIQQLPAFNASLGGKTVGILHVFVGFTDSLPVDTLNSIEQNGSIPMIDWGCKSLSDINDGMDDDIIKSFASSIVSFGKPVFLRWYWEMNNPNNLSSCYSDGDQQAFKSAWVRIWNIFHHMSATNVAFVWCPNAGSDTQQYYPGDSYVDWIGVDGFDNGTGLFPQPFVNFYNTWSGTKPLMIGATGGLRQDDDEGMYIDSISTNFQQNYPNYKAFLYFDAPGQNNDYTLGGGGTAAFATVLNTDYFFGGSNNSVAADRGLR